MFSSRRLVVCLSIFALLGVVFTVPRRGAAEEEERVIGIEGEVVSMEMSVERSNHEGKTYDIVTIRLELDAGDELCVYEDTSKRRSKVPELVEEYQKLDSHILLFTAQFLADDEDINAYTGVSPGDRVVLRTPYRYLSSFLQDPAKPIEIYQVEKVE